MRKNSLVENQGLSISQAQSISNLCNQRAREISNKLSLVNNYSKKISVEDKEHILVTGIIMPENVVDLLKSKAELHACQAFLMENIKAKTTLLMAAKSEKVDISSVEMSKPLELVRPEVLREVDDNFGWEQLTVTELNEYHEVEAYASHIGQFIHEGGILNELRSELPTIPTIDWMVIKDGIKTPISVHIHHNSEGLLSLHEELAGLHRKYEQRVNYYKAKVNNLVTAENARIAKINADAINDAQRQNNILRGVYNNETAEANNKLNSLRSQFEIKRQEKMKTIAAMRISVDARFQKVIDMFLSTDNK